MPESTPSGASSNDLQFSTKEPVTQEAPDSAVGQSCVLCGQPIDRVYYAVGEKLLCPACSTRVQAPPAGTKLGRFTKAFFFGLGAGLLGALIWFAIRRATGFEIGLVALLVGFMVGKAVFKGSRNQGGRGYQVMAVLLTYGCIAANYMPDVIEAVFDEARKQHVAEEQAVNNANQPEAAPVNDAGAIKAAEVAPKVEKPPPTLLELIGAIGLLLIFALGLSLALPFLGGADNLIGILIIGFALWEAWKFNSRREIPISGPYLADELPAA